jgi:hypothetical protein
MRQTEQSVLQGFGIACSVLTVSANPTGIQGNESFMIRRYRKHAAASPIAPLPALTVRLLFNEEGRQAAVERARAFERRVSDEGLDTASAYVAWPLIVVPPRPSASAVDLPTMSGMGRSFVEA